jgi:DNA segregation ATPase FtsK/SpoIIIE-like protein
MDDLLDEAVSVILQYDRVAASLLQRRLSIGYARSARIVDQLEDLGLIAPTDGSAKPREVLIKSIEEYKKIRGANIKQEETIVEPIKDDYEPTSPRLTPDEIEIGTKIFKFSEIGNLIVTGNAISKKFVFLDNYINSILENYRLTETKLIIYDSFGILKKYDSVPHLLTPVVTNDLFISTLRWATREVDRRIEAKITTPKIVLVINSCMFGIEETDAIKRISSIGTLQGIHMIIVNDSVKDIPRQIRDNIPARLEFDKLGKYKATFEFGEKVEINIV